MESGNSSINLKSLSWESLEERRLKTKLCIFQKGRLGDIVIPTDHLTLKTRTTRRGGGGPGDGRPRWGRVKSTASSRPLWRGGGGSGAGRLGWGRRGGGARGGRGVRRRADH